MAVQVDRVDGVLALMRLDKVVPSPTTYNMLLRAAVAAADCEAVCKYVRHMQADGVFATRQVVLAAKELAEQLGNELAVTYTRQVLERPVERRDGGRGRNFY